VWNKDRDDERWHAGRLGILATPTDNFENYTMIYGAKSDNNGPGVVNEGFNIAGLTAAGICDDVPGGAVSCDVYRDVPTPENKRQTAPGEDVFSTLETWGVTNTTDYRISDALKIRNVASYHHLKSRYTLDWDGTVLQHENAGALRQPAPGQVVIPGVGPITFNNSIADDGLPSLNVELITEELQVQGSAFGGRLQYTAGGFYSKQQPGGAVGETGDISSCPADQTGQPGACPVALGAASSVEQVSKALYAQGTLDLGVASPALDGVRLTGGYRETWDETTGTSSLRPPVTLKYSAPSWLVGVDYRVVPEVLLFAKVSRGYKSGGYNASAVRPSTLTFGPETVTNYEAGFKADFKVAEMPIRLNASYYNMDYRGIQRASGDFAFPQIPGFSAGGAQIVNADAKVQGIETEFSIRPARGLEFGGIFGWTKGKYKEYSFPLSLPAVDCEGFKDPFTTPGVVADYSCNPFSGVAEYVWSVHASFDHELPNDMGSLAFFVSYSHSSEIPTLGLGIESLEPLSRLEPFGLLNASVDWNNVANSGFDVGVFATNLTDELYRVSYNNLYSSFANYGASLYGEPRMFGVRVRRKFGEG
jgi:iron complex outermembrane receptor protein